MATNDNTNNSKSFSTSENEIRQIIGEDYAGDLEGSQLHAVVPKLDCPHLNEINEVGPDGINIQSPCLDCSNIGENWICLSCYKVYCGRFVNEHMLMHGIESNHPLVLSFADLSVWCYKCDSYIHHPALLPAKRAAHINKFGIDIHV
ncbi:DgyrCDS6666 [Dimorphilus gyrociliatus]|uniref:DgyrCDS6666 n=1 Tax=Dimorphilus gyrociliatus TaxID=2664684 RepID=A0A7I8VNU9_9ANNE|nr:DgyrCDS6666 [Dimorphilus gyrociliatus]